MTCEPTGRLRSSSVLRLNSQVSLKTIETLRIATGDEDLRASLYEEFGDELFTRFAKISAALEKRLADWGSDDDEEGGSTKKELPAKKKWKRLDAKPWERDDRLRLQRVRPASTCTR